MLKPAQLYKEQLSAALIETWYDLRYQFYNSNEYCYVPDYQNNNERYWQFVSVDNDDNLLGYITFCADRKTMTANWWGALSFHIGDIRFIRDLFDMVRAAFYKYGFERISWVCVADNPATNGYRKFIKRHGGRECGYYRQSTRLMDGKLHDEVCFEILKTEFNIRSNVRENVRTKDKECCANCEYWEEKYQKCEHSEQFASKAEDYAAMPEDVCELYLHKHISFDDGDSNG